MRQQYHVMYGPAFREGNAYKYETSVVPGFPPWHPNPGKSALLCVTTSGVVKLFFQQNNNKHEFITVDMENVNSSEDRITHASLTSDRSKSDSCSSWHCALAHALQLHFLLRSQLLRSSSKLSESKYNGVSSRRETNRYLLRAKH